MPDVLRPQHPGEQHRPERGREEQRDGGCAGERAQSEQRAIDQRVGVPGAVEGEQRERGNGDREGGDRPGIPPTPAAALDQAERERTDAAGNQERPDSVGNRHWVTRDVRQPSPANREREQTDWHVDEEHPAPAGGYQQAADHRSRCRSDAADGGPRANRAMTALRFGGRKDQPQRGRGQERRPCCLEDAEANEHRDASRGAARRRRRDEHRDPEQEAAIAAVALGQTPEQHQQRGVDDRVGVQHPGQVRQAAGLNVEIPAHLRQRDVDDE